jgi:hypothetical protein
MGYSIRRVVAVALISTWTLGSAELARASFASVVGIEAAYCSTSWQSIVDPEASVVEDFELFPGYCSATISPPTSHWLFTTVEGHPSDRSVHGVSEYICGGDMVLDGVISASVSRVNPTLVVVSGEYRLDFNFFPTPNDCGSAEIALIRFAGDPAAFIGLVPKTVHDFVTAGLIEEGDILFVQDEFLWLSLNDPVPFSFDVPIGGVPDDQIYLFSTLQTPLPEPSGQAMLLAGVSGVYGLARIKFRWRCG